MATLIGTPPNIILAGIVKESMGIEISFLDWMLFATPFSIVLLLLSWFLLTRYKANAKAENIDEQLRDLGKMTTQEKRVLLVFSLVALMWISRSFLLNRIIPTLDDTIIAVLGAVVMFIIPAGNGKGNLMDWKSARNLPWDILLIFGAGLAIAKGFSNTDLTFWLAGHFSQLNFLPTAALFLIVIASINFLTEITSNTATASMVLPLLITLGISLKMDTLPLLAGSALAASCAFMLPVATPPNAIVFSSGKIKIRDMIMAGFKLNIISIILIFLFTQTVWRLIFG
jgi:sodium-dependent dicarboxylate transporter 2/3/5